MIKKAGLNLILFDSVNVNPGEIIVSAGFDISNRNILTIFVDTIENFDIYIQFTDDPLNPIWRDLYTGAFTCNNQNLAIPIPCSAIQARVLMQNNDIAADTPYLGVE